MYKLLVLELLMSVQQMQTNVYLRANKMHLN